MGATCDSTDRVLEGSDCTQKTEKVLMICVTLLADYSSSAAVRDAILAAAYMDETATNTSRALDYAREVMFTPQAGNRRDIPDVVLIITDGESVDTLATINAAR